MLGEVRLLVLCAGKQFDVVVKGLRVDGTLDASGGLRLERLYTLKAAPKPRHSPQPAPAVPATAPALQGTQGTASQSSQQQQQQVVRPQTAELGVSAEGRLLTGQLYIADGVVTVPEELK